MCFLNVEQNYVKKRLYFKPNKSKWCNGNEAGILPGMNNMKLPFAYYLVEMVILTMDVLKYLFKVVYCLSFHSNLYLDHYFEHCNRRFPIQLWLC